MGYFLQNIRRVCVKISRKMLLLKNIKFENCQYKILYNSLAFNVFVFGCMVHDLLYVVALDVCEPMYKAVLLK